MSTWYKELNKAYPYVFKIVTQDGHGTGFEIFAHKDGTRAIATAYHVIQKAFEWDQPIKIIHGITDKTVTLRADQKSRVIIPYIKEDLAFILFTSNEIAVSGVTPPLINQGAALNPGNDIMWLGFPSVAPNKLCLFEGCISCSVGEESLYLIDGTVINGVSGGPVFFIEEGTNDLKILGVISAYAPNRIGTETLPGLGIARYVEPYQKDLFTLKNMAQAAEKAKEEKEKQETPPSPINPGDGTPR